VRNILQAVNHHLMTHPVPTEFGAIALAANQTYNQNFNFSHLATRHSMNAMHSLKRAFNYFQF
jgi:hypothetical protein